MEALDLQIRPIAIGDEQGLIDLSNHYGLAHMRDPEKRKIASYCRNSAGVVAVNFEKRIIGSCYHQRLSVRPLPGAKPGKRLPFTLLSNLVVATPYQNYGVGLALAKATAAFAFATTSGIFPGVLCFSYQDNSSSRAVQSAAHVLIVDQDSAELGSSEQLLAADAYAREVKSHYGTSKPHSIGVLPMPFLVEFAREVVIGHLSASGLINERGIAFHYAFNPNSGIIETLIALGQLEERALKRLNLADTQDSMTPFLTRETA